MFYFTDTEICLYAYMFVFTLLRFTGYIVAFVGFKSLSSFLFFLLRSCLHVFAFELYLSRVSTGIMDLRLHQNLSKIPKILRHV